ncbi:uncharacterized protein LOC121889443 isoform X1 [Scomber scombrus]|uniref:Uncharacterized protein LOC121889443 isoform X1 n=1 Tax=Scomber scombrus TaxID=13677 RepID=A0AAV1PVV4_SCOSC
MIKQEKMICRILLLISLTSCVTGTLVVNVTQTFYQAEENHDITLEWTFITNPNSSFTYQSIFCDMLTEYKIPVLYYVREGAKIIQSQYGKFAGRVQGDEDALKEGRIRLHMSRLKTEDSGLYKCIVFTKGDVSSDSCILNVTASVDQPKPQGPTVRPQLKRWGRIGLYVGVIVAVLAVGSGLCFLFRLNSKRNERKHSVVPETEKIDAAV